MFIDIVEDFRTKILKYFPERQIYLRSGGEVSYFVFSTRVQLAFASVLLFLAAWCLITISTLFIGNNPFSSSADRAKLVKAEYERLLDDAEAKYANAQVQLEMQQKNFEMAARTFQEKHAALAAVSGSNASAETLAMSLPQPVMQDDGRSGEVLMAALTRDPTPRQARWDITSLTIDDPALDELEFDRIASDQNNVLKIAERNTAENIERLRAVIESTDLDVEAVLDNGAMGSGGPLVSISDFQSLSPEQTRITSIKARAYEAKLLTDAVKSLPLGHPVAADNYRTSPFGVRRDPFTKRPAMHEALDFASYRKAPIVATASGKVVKAGWNGTYGKMVDIDHGHGFVTRYAHLENILVKRGQTVELGDTIGEMGSTGRSTSTHLHYEVHFQDRVYDPANFLKAGRYVQQK